MKFEHKLKSVDYTNKEIKKKKHKRIRTSGAGIRKPRGRLDFI